jgi:NAD(P)-dependent dehydrogenase (short-subunit alcohol dehydrogenase family)
MDSARSGQALKSLKELITLTGRVALITGGAGHLGSVMAEALAELGAAIAVVDLAQERCARVTRVIEERLGVETLAIAVDLRDSDSVRAIARRVRERFGRLDILINCAALVGSSELPGWNSSFEEQRVETWREALEVNLTAPFVLTQAATELLRASGHGTIINVGSIYGLVGPDWSLYEGTKLGNPAAYAASKGGLLQLTRWMATTLAPEIRVNVITAGGVYRETAEPFLSRYIARVPLGRMATEEDFKGAVAYLASDLSAYVTGQNIVVDGGWTAW